MDNNEINSLFKIAALFAECTYQELFNYKPDKSRQATQELLDALMQAWLTGYAHCSHEFQLSNTIEEIFGFFVESDY